MNTKYIENKKQISEKKGHRALHCAQSLWRAYWRNQIERPDTIDSSKYYDLLLHLGIESLPKNPHDGMLEGRQTIFNWYIKNAIRGYLTDLAKAEEENNE